MQFIVKQKFGFIYCYFLFPFLWYHLCNIYFFLDTPRSMYYLHTFTWVLNIFGVFFILAGHEHYSIDIFIAFYISTRLFLYYHALANNRAFVRDDRRRTRIWFPLFYFFESGVDGPVPNEYEWPFHLPERVQQIISRFFVWQKSFVLWIKILSYLRYFISVCWKSLEEIIYLCF